jgi:hypothetical protein
MIQEELWEAEGDQVRHVVAEGSVAVVDAVKSERIFNEKYRVAVLVWGFWFFCLSCNTSSFLFP